MDLQLSGKRAIVTGGSRGIGFAVAQALAAEGVAVTLVARDRAALDRAAAELGGGAVGVVADTTDDHAVRSMVAVAGRVDILVNAAARPAGSIPDAPASATTDDSLREQLETKVLGYLRCARAVAPQMVDRVSVNGDAVAVGGGQPGVVHY